MCKKRYDDVAVYTTYVAKRLLELKYQIVNLRKNKNEEGKTVFYFKNEGNIQQDLKIIQGK
ncbi:hypothetical protein [Inediibacterium massiliense]|uniref:hypothetical protein n=1 Tax=Inediibacterium massiliense TaxID=1658111 RepID=UPI0006B40895|nr:hypothetical protein [Inediibacterium massiliense]